MLAVALISGGAVYGVLGLKIKEEEMGTDVKMFLDSVTSVVSVSLERIALSHKNSENAVMLAREELKNALYGSISHDLRTPLAHILGMMSILSEDPGLDEKKRELVADAIAGVRRMERLITNLLDSARFESQCMVLRKDWCDIADIFSSALGQFEEALKRRKVELKPAGELTLLKADCVLVERVVVNLLDNAAKYSRPEGSIAISFSQHNGRVYVYVENESEPIPEEEIERLFDKFYRTKGSGDNIDGSGLGLFICKKIIEAHRGEIWAQNIPGGVRFGFFIPQEE